MAKNKTVRVKCNDECGIIEFKNEFDGKYNILYVNYYVDAFYANQHDFFDIWKKRLGMIFDILRGKEYMLFDTIVLNEDDQKEFRNKLKEFLDD